jgi:hemerythrin-like metal-binding protein
MKTKLYVEWKDSFSVKNAQIDSQHKKMFRLLNKLHDLLQKGGDVKRLGKIIVAVQQYAILHFNCEELLMSACNYPQLNEHKKAHEEFTSRFNQFLKRAKTENEDISLELFLFLKDWLLDHITTEDKAYIPFVVAWKRDRHPVGQAGVNHLAWSGTMRNPELSPKTQSRWRHARRCKRHPVGGTFTSLRQLVAKHV